MPEANHNDYKLAFGSESGHRVLEDLSRFCLENRQTFDPNNMYMAAFNEGARSVILKIRKEMRSVGDELQEPITGE